MLTCDVLITFLIHWNHLLLLFIIIIISSSYHSQRQKAFPPFSFFVGSQCVLHSASANTLNFISPPGSLSAPDATIPCSLLWSFVVRAPSVYAWCDLHKTIIWFFFFLYSCSIYILLIISLSLQVKPSTFFLFIPLWALFSFSFSYAWRQSLRAVN